MMEGDNIEQRARDMGWVPLEEFRSGPDKWVDAKTFVEKGENVLPIVRAQNRRLEEKLNRLQTEHQRALQMFQASQESITELQQFHEQNLEQQLKAQRARLAEELAVARETGDTHREVEIQGEIADLGKETKPVQKPPVQQPPQQHQQIHPDMAAWMQDNPWYGSDTRKTTKANGIAQMLRGDPANDHLEGRAFFDRVTQIMNGEQLPTNTKVGGGRPSGQGGGSGGGKGSGYDSLPPEAREACDKQARKLVGEGRAFKDQASWQAYYAQIYFKGERS